MRPVSQCALSLSATNCAPSAATRIADRPPKSRWEEVSAMPPRNSSAPKRTWDGARGSKTSIGAAAISIRAGGSGARFCASAGEAARANAKAMKPAIHSAGRARSALPIRRAPRTSTSRHPNPDLPGFGIIDAQVGQARLAWERRGGSSMQSPPRDARRDRLVLVEQFGELVGHRAAQLLGVDDGDGAAVIARDVVTDADRDQLDRRARLDVLDHPAQVALEIVSGIDRERGVVDRRAVRDHHQ